MLFHFFNDLTRPVDKFPIETHTRMSKNRFVHAVIVEAICELDDLLRHGLYESYLTVGGDDLLVDFMLEVVS